MAFANVRQMAWVLGTLRGASDPTANHAVTAYTDGGTLTANLVQFETVMPIPLIAAARFITFSVDAAETNCTSSHAMFKFYLLNGALEIPTFTSPIDPCSDPNATTMIAPAVGENPAKAFKVGAFAGNAATLFSGSQVGVRMRNGQASTIGNDAAFDNIEVLDATPQLDKSFSPTVLSAGARSQLTFTITNTSELAAKDGWSFIDTLPDGLVVASPSASATTCPQPTTVTARAGGNSISVKGDLAAGTNYCVVTIDVTSASEGIYVDGPANISGASGINPPGPAQVTFADNADLKIEKSASPIPGAPDSDETYELNVTNKGPNVAQDTIVSDQLPAGLSIVSVSPGCQIVAPTLAATATAPGPRANTPRRRLALPSGPVVRCSLGSLAVDAHVTIALVAHIASTVIDGFINTAVVSSSTPDPELANNAAAAATPIPPNTDLEIQKSASVDAVTAGGQVTYTLVVKNNGPNEATGVLVADPVPAQLNVVSAQPSQGTCAGSNGVVCNLGSIHNGASVQILITATVAASAGGALTNMATVAGGQTDPEPTNNAASATTDVAPVTPDPLPGPPVMPASEPLASITSLPVPDQLVSDLQIVKHVNRPTSHVGQTLTYTLRVTNRGPDDASDVQVEDTWSLDMKVLASHTTQGSCRIVGSVICSLGSLQRNTAATITLTAKVGRAGTETNTARVTSANRDPNPHNNQSSVETSVFSTPPPVTG